MRPILAHILAAIAALSCACSSPQPKPGPSDSAKHPRAETVVTSRPKRIILMIGDGMGVPVLTAAAYNKGAPLALLELEEMGWMTTHEHEFVTTDSAASATAMATGKKTHFNGISVKPGTMSETEADPSTWHKTLLEHARDRKMRTGLIATTRIVHATPAAFAAHRSSRSNYEGVAEDFTRFGVDLMLGAGTRYFSQREDGRDLLGELREKGHTILEDPEALRAAAANPAGPVKVVGLFHERDMPFVRDGGRAISLAEMTKLALPILDRNNPEGFVLVVEGSFIDWCEHALDAACAVTETLDFDAAVRVVLEDAKGRDDTLVVVTADHETGGLSVIDPRFSSELGAVFGGEAAAEAATNFPPAAGGKHPQPAQIVHLPVGELEPGGALVPSELADKRLTTVFGHLSVASRAVYTKERRFAATHTAAMVPVFASGTAAEWVAHVRDNADLGARLIELVAGGEQTYKRPVFPNPRPRNVILLIGDGLGVGAATATYYATGRLAMRDTPVQGLVATHASDRVVNDSAGAATALAAGVRTRERALGLALAGNQLMPVDTVLVHAERRGLKTGIVTTTSVTHATPAAFFAQLDDREQNEAIAEALVNLPVRGGDGVDVVLGGGSKFFSADLRKQLAGRGVTWRSAWDPARAPGQLFGLFAEDGLAPAAFRLRDGDPSTPTLAEMTALAVDHLDDHPEGFFLMVEGGQIDWVQHDMKRDRGVIDEVADFDAAVHYALEYARKHRDTLVIATADHDQSLSLLDNHYRFHSDQCGAAKRCGGNWELSELDVAPNIHNGEGLTDRTLQGDFAPPKLFLQYAWLAQEAGQRKNIPGPHTANFVPLFAFGPGAEAFKGFVDQPEIGAYLVAWATR